MPMTQVESIVGKPDFVRPHPMQVEYIYMLQGEEINSYKFIDLYFDSTTKALRTGIYEKPSKKPPLPGETSAALRALPYQG